MTRNRTTPISSLETPIRRVGASNTLFEIGTAASDLGITRPQLADLLARHAIPLIQIGRLQYFNLYWLEKLLFIATSPGHLSTFVDKLDLKGDSIVGTLTEEFVASATIHHAASREQLRARLQAMAKGKK